MEDGGRKEEQPSDPHQDSKDCGTLRRSQVRGNTRLVSEDMGRGLKPGPCNNLEQWDGEGGGTLRFLPQLEMRPSSNAPSPVESREAPPTSSVPGFSEPP